jgi:hypothetical protein
MRYMMMIYGDEKAWEELSAQKRDTVHQSCVDYSEPRRPSGFYQGGGRLEPTHTATTVRMKGGQAILTDGPFAETKEQLAGFTILEAKDLDEALAFVEHHPLVKAGFSVEVRPFRVAPSK